MRRLLTNTPQLLRVLAAFFFALGVCADWSWFGVGQLHEGGFVCAGLLLVTLSLLWRD